MDSSKNPIGPADIDSSNETSISDNSKNNNQMTVSPHLPESATIPLPKLNYWNAAIQYIQIMHNIDEREKQRYLKFVGRMLDLEEEREEEREMERRRTLIANKSKESHDPLKKKFQKCLLRYDSYVSRCNRLKVHEPNLKWQPTDEIEKELEEYQRIEQFDDFWKTLREMESRISRIESRYFPFQVVVHRKDFREFLQDTWNTLKKPFVFAKTKICNCLKNVSSKESQ
ncbi:hypothetical protein GCK72_013404 [Caenorhabditis remanei]|uniref:Uncharacterized protein n=1 Tax=Caenorhabditis remanei TaxID=31234 RepID=A0A6A5GR53_CAERE|nr:hypothetical protein GCK72_013404 [Caenorhabditis remanei]KAF1756949.1 hypothetical protein GCK72_013404 [Caenorhabditis remanei]